MKITTGDGQKFELESVIKHAVTGDVGTLYRLMPLKPVRKVEEKRWYEILFIEDNVLKSKHKQLFDGELTKDTALKLSEVFSAIVEYIQDPRETTAVSEEDSLMYKITEAWKSYQEGQ